MMSNRNSDINDDEIRIISSDRVTRPHRKSRLAVWLCVVVALLAVCGIALLFLSTGESVESSSVASAALPRSAGNIALPSDSVPAALPFVERKDTLVDGVELVILTPRNATPILEIGNSVINDSSAVLVAQAADVREDNGLIVGSFVVRGELVSKGEAKAGFCSVINGDISIGAADTTPMLEEALMSDGYFFRQYPLVVGGQVVENKPKGKSIRRALAEIDGRICVIISENRVTFHDFSQALVGAHVRNAIYLVGGIAYARYTDATGRATTFGKEWADISNANYIVWR